MTGKRELKNAAKEILKYNISQLIIRKGEHGAILFNSNRMYPFIAYDRLGLEYIDPSGCGSVLAGAFLAFLQSNTASSEPLNDPLYKALAFALVVRSFKIEDIGYDRLLYLNGDDIWRRYDQFRDMLSI